MSRTARVERWIEAWAGSASEGMERLLETVLGDLAEAGEAEIEDLLRATRIFSDLELGPGERAELAARIAVFEPESDSESESVARLADAIVARGEERIRELEAEVARTGAGEPDALAQLERLFSRLDREAELSAEVDALERELASHSPEDPP